MLNLIPSADRVIIKPDADSEKKIGSIIIPQTAWQEYTTGEVVAVGPGPTGEHGSCPMTSKVGDRVIFPPNLGRAIPVSDEAGVTQDYIVLRQHEVSITLQEDGKTPAKKGAKK